MKQDGAFQPHTKIVLRERDESGQTTAIYSASEEGFHENLTSKRAGDSASKRKLRDLRSLLKDMFLPAGYPVTVSPDYLPYQIYNALQAFCSSLAGLLASRAVLEGHGVGDASASATYAILLTVFQDVFSRLTTIAGAYYLGTSLFPEAKTYRLLADVLNDTAILLDALSPHLGTFSLSMSYPFFRRGRATYLRVASLCLSGSFRALCGVSAGGSKAALTVHFASSGKANGDVGDLNAKDASKETVLGLLGMLCGSIVMQYVQTSRSTYAILFTLVFLHLAANYMAVRVVVMRNFNRQRASIVWKEFVESQKIITPEVTAARESIFADPTSIQPYGTCHLGSPLSCIIPPMSMNTHQHILTSAQVLQILEVFSNDRYILWIDSHSRPSHPVMHICLKEGHTSLDHLKGWIHAHQVLANTQNKDLSSFDARASIIKGALEHIDTLFLTFIKQARRAGWRVDEGVLLAGSPKTISIQTEDLDGSSKELYSDERDKKKQS